MTWQMQPLLPAGHNKSHAAGVCLGFPTGLKIIRTLYFTQYFSVGGPTQSRNVENVVINRFRFFMIKIMHVQHFHNGIRREGFFFLILPH